jgi:hypothetical protein
MMSGVGLDSVAIRSTASVKICFQECSGSDFCIVDLKSSLLKLDLALSSILTCSY